MDIWTKYSTSNNRRLQWVKLLSYQQYWEPGITLWKEKLNNDYQTFHNYLTSEITKHKKTMTYDKMVLYARL